MWPSCRSQAYPDGKNQFKLRREERYAARQAASNSGVDSGSSANAARSSLISSQKRMPCVAEMLLMNRYEQANICKYINRYEARSTVYSATATVLIVPPQVDSDA